MQLKTKFGYAMTGAGVATALLMAGTTFAQRVYSDVPPAHWAYNAVQWTSQYGIMVGPGGQSGFFNAAGFANRAEIATVIYRMFNMVDRDINDLRVRIELLEEEIEGSSRSSARSSSVSSGTHRFSASLSGSAEVPSVSTNASGGGTFTWNESSNSLSYDIAVNNLTGPIIAAHFHGGVAGQEGGPIRDITFSGNRATGTWSALTSQQRIDLFAGRIYVNVHTTLYPDGEIRGQVTSNSASSMSSSSVSSASSSMSSSSSLSSSFSSGSSTSGSSTSGSSSSYSS